MTVSYQLRRVYLVIWAWQVEREGRVIKAGFALSKPAARWAARGVVRSARGQATDAAPG